MTVDNSNLTLQQHIKEQTVNLINYTEIIKNMTNTLLENKILIKHGTLNLLLIVI